MKNLPEHILKKVEIIKSIILTRSGLLSEYGNNLSFTIGDIHYDNNTDTVIELVLEVKFEDIYCTECDFEPENISEIIMEIKNKIYQASNIGLNEDLKLNNKFSSLRGVLFYDCKIWRDQFTELNFGIFFDPGQTY